ncbi:MAG: sialidase [Eubacterium sp.]
MRQMKAFKKSFIALVAALVVAVSGIPEIPVTAATTVSAPASLTFKENSDTSCTITWKAVSGATYNVYKAKSRYATYSKIATVSTTSYTDDSYDDGYYKVTAVVGGTESSKSAATSYEISVFGYNTNIFEPTTDNTNEIQSYIDTVYKTTEAGQFGTGRYAFMFAPGTYSDDLTVKIGFYTQVAGMGLSPEDTTLGNIRCQAEWMKGIKYDGEVNYNALCNFWRSVENLTTTAKSTMWAVSQATSMRRMNIKGNLLLHQNGGYASGGFLADTKIAGEVSGASQQQWLTRNSEMSKFEGVVWNNVLVGCGATVKGSEGQWPYAANTVVAKTPEEVEKPFLTIDDNGDYGVFVPEIKKNSEGVSWDGENIAGEFIGLDSFYVAKPTDTAATINAAIAGGKNLILTPGIYNISEPIKVTNENTVILGLGYATLKPTNGNQCMTVGNVGGVKIAGVLFDAGTKKSAALLTVGTAGDKTSHADNPIVLCDTFYRVGGADATPCKTTACVIINSSNVIGDNFWVWRADHGSGVGWDKNTCDYGVIINGENVTTYGLMVEHFQKYQTQWNGNGGKCYMYQSELPYDIKSQSVWNAPGSYGYTDYKVASNVTTHEGYGIGIYSCYQAATCFLKSAIECPDKPGVKFTNVCTYSLSGNGSIDYAINQSGYAVMASSEMCKVMSYCNGKYTMDKTADAAKKYIWSTKISIKGKSDFDSTFNVTYTGKALTPKVTITYQNIALREGVDYKVTYSNNKKIGTAKITITGLNGFKDTETYKFKIVPAKVKKLAKKKATKKKIKIKWGKVKGAGGYQVVYSQKKNFKKKTAVKVKKTQTTIKRKSKSAYYIKVRAYKKANGKYYYGSYSKKIKIKKVK